MSISTLRAGYHRTGYPRGGRRGRGVSPMRPANGLVSVLMLTCAVGMLLLSVFAFGAMLATGFWFLTPLPLFVGGTTVPLVLLVLGDEFLGKNFRPVLNRTLSWGRARSAGGPRRSTWHA